MSNQLTVVVDPTDRQRVEAMFGDLNAKRGIFAAMSLGTSNVNALRELQEILHHGQPYCFFDQKDAEAFGVDGYLRQTLFLSWGLMQDPVVDTVIPEDWMRCAEKIVTAGILAGLHITWEGTGRKRIGVQPSRTISAAPTFHSRN